MRGRLFLIGCGLLLSVAAVEAAYRIARTKVCVGRDAGALYAAHPDHGWEHLPDASVWIYGCDGREYEFQNRVSTNSNGLRDFETAYDKPPDTLRVLLLGDTITEALQVSLEETFSEILEARLGSTLGKVEVINTGCASYGTDNELLYYRNEGRRYDADLVLLVLSTRNDAIDVSASLHPRTSMASRFPPKTYFTLDEAGELRREPAGQVPTTAIEASPGAQAWSAIHANLFAVRALGRLLSPNPEAPAPGPASAAPPGWQANYRTPMSDEIVRGWLVVERLVATLERDVHADGGELLVAVMPGREEVEAALGDGEFAPNWDIDQGNRIARSLLERLDVAYIDLLEPLRRNARRTESTGFYTVDVHLASEGHRVVADELTDWLKPKLTALRQRQH